VIDFTLTDECGADCPKWIEKWVEWWNARVKEREPLAMMECGHGYVESLPRASRRMVRVANTTYEFREFTYNNCLSDLSKINQSKSVRQGRPMADHYLQPAKPHRPLALCERHRDTWYGGFSRETGEMKGYARLETFGETGLLNVILRHGESLGVLNGLFSYMNDNANVKLINYLRIASATETLTAFKRRVGFRPWDPVTSEFIEEVHA